MTRKLYDDLDDKALVKAFSDAAVRLGEAINYWMSANKAARQLFDISRVFRSVDQKHVSP